jgi:hypothetical protein
MSNSPMPTKQKKHINTWIVCLKFKYFVFWPQSKFVLYVHIAHLRQQCHNSKCVIFQERLLKVSKCHNYLWVQRRHNCSPAASFANCVTTLHLLKVHLQTFLSNPITQKCQILSGDTLVANERYDFQNKVLYYFRNITNQIASVIKTQYPLCCTYKPRVSCNIWIDLYVRPSIHNYG